MRVADIRAMGRNTQGVRVINLKPGDAIADVARLIIENGDEAEAISGDGSAALTTGSAAEAPAAPTAEPEAPKAA